MIVAQVFVFLVSIAKVRRKGGWFVIERYNTPAKERVIAGPMPESKIAAAIAARRRYWEDIRKTITPETLA